MQTVKDFVHAFLDMLFGKDGTKDWAAWAALAGTILFVMVIRIKRCAKAHIGWGVLILPLLLAIASTVYALISPRTGQLELAVAGSALVIVVLLFWQAVRAFPRKTVVQIPLLLLALMLAVTAGLDAVLNYQGIAISFSIAHVANGCSKAVAVLAAVSAVTLVIAFWVVLIRGIIRWFKH